MRGKKRGRDRLPGGQERILCCQTRFRDRDEEATGAGGEKEKEGLMLAVLLCWLPPPRVSG